MSTTFTYPTNAELNQVDQVFLPALTLDDPIFQFFPVRPHDSHVLIWEQRDDYLGLQQVRGLNGEPPRVKNPGGKRYVMEPGVYGEFAHVDEMEITTRRQWGTFNAPIDISDLVMERQTQLRARQVARIRFVLWQLLTYGRFTVLAANGAIAHQDAYTQRTYTAANAWSDDANSTPLADFRAVALLGRGYGTSFGSGATAFMNQQTANYMLANTNSADLYGRRSAGLSTLNTLTLVNQLLTGDGLPTIQIIEDGYKDDNGDFQLYVPDNRVIVVGRRPGNAPLGQFAITRNANATPVNAPQSYTIVTESKRPPKTVTIDYGFSGGPQLWFPGSVITMDVS